MSITVKNHYAFSGHAKYEITLSETVLAMTHTVPNTMS